MILINIINWTRFGVNRPESLISLEPFNCVFFGHMAV